MVQINHERQVSRMGYRNRKRGQSTAEYLIVLALVLAAVTAMQVFGERALKGKMFGAWNKFASVGNGSNYLTTQAQYEPYYINENTAISQNQLATTNIREGGGVNRIANTFVTRTGSSVTMTNQSGGGTWR